MVVGGMVLLYKGTITLGRAAAKDAIKVEFRQFINVTARYPALGLFIIGLAFIISAMMFARGLETRPLKIQGRVVADDLSTASVVVTSRLREAKPSTDGQVNEKIRPVVDTVTFQAIFPGFDPPTSEKTLYADDNKDGVLDFGILTSTGRRVASKPPVDPSNIVPILSPPVQVSGAP